MTHLADAGWTVFILPSSHNDIGWAGTPTEIAEHRATAIVDVVLDLMERDPDYAFAMEATLYLREYLERRPDSLPRIRRFLDQGRLEWGASYIQPYEGLLSGESLLRQLYWGRRWAARHLGVTTAGYWNIDVQARTAQLPQILAGAGVQYMVLSRNEPGLYWWEAPDGSRVLTLSLMEGAYGRARVLNTHALHLSPLEGRHAYGSKPSYSVEGLARELVPFLQRWEPFFAQYKLPRIMLIAAVADYSVPDEGLQALIRQWNSAGERGDLGLPGPITLRFGNVGQYVQALRRESDLAHLPVVRGDMPNPWVYIHSPCHHKTVDALRAAGRYLVMAEMASAAAQIVARTPATGRGRLAEAWLAHLYPDHGYGGLHGEGTDEVFRYREESAWFSARQIAREALVAIARALPAVPEALRIMVIFNTLSWCRTDWVEAECAFAPDEGVPAVKLVDSDGATIETQVLNLTRSEAGDLLRVRLGFVARDIPATGYVRYTLLRSERLTSSGLSPLEAGIPEDYEWENEGLRVRLTRGGLVECYDKAHRRTLIAADYYLGGEVVELGSPGHDVGEGERDIDTFDWRVVRPFQPNASGLERTADRADALVLHEEGPLRTRVSTTSRFSHCIVRQTFSLYRDLPRIDLQVDIHEWTGTHGREVRVFFPIGAPAAEVSYDTPFAMVQVGRDELSDFAAMRPREVQSWIHAEHEGTGLTLSSSVVAHDWRDPIDRTSRPVLQAVLLSTKRSCHPKGPWYTQKGNHSFKMALMAGAHAIEERTRFGWERQQPCEMLILQADELSSGHGVPPRLSLLTVEPPNVVLTILKPAEDGEGFIVRCCEIAGRETEARIQPGTDHGMAVWRCNLLEEEETPGPVVRAGQTFTLPVAAFGVATFKLLLVE